VLDTSGLRACAKDIGWKDNKLLFELAGSDESKPSECAGLKGYSMVFESKNPKEFGWSLAVPTGQYLQAAAEGELSLRKDVKKGMWLKTQIWKCIHETECSYFMQYSSKRQIGQPGIKIAITSSKN
jgi:hypothetical protein